MPGTPHYPKDIGDKFREIQQQVRDGRTASQSRTGYNEVAKGSLTVVNDDGQEVAKFGYLGTVGPDAIYGMSVHRADGTEALRLWSSASGANTVEALVDRTGHIVLSDDAVSGQGIATPHIPMGQPQVAGNPAIIPVFWPRTTSGTMVTLLETYTPALQPKIRAIVYGFADASTTGEFDVLVNGTSIVGSTTPIPAGNFGGPTGGPYAVPGWAAGVGYGDEIHIEIQCRRISGTGSVYVQCLGLYGYQS